MKNQNLIKIGDSEYGRGLFSCEDIDKGTLIEISTTISIPLDEMKLIHKTILCLYTFFEDDSFTTECICLGLGSLFNHSFNENVNFERGEGVIKFFTIKDVRKGEELFINYDYDPLEYKEEYLEKKKEK
jgi:uncharacterized protein